LLAVGHFDILRDILGEDTLLGVDQGDLGDEEQLLSAV